MLNGQQIIEGSFPSKYNGNKINKNNGLYSSFLLNSQKINNSKNEFIDILMQKNITKINKNICRICYGEESNDENPLISPCKCNGSMKYIHYKCLKKWQKSKIEDELSMESQDNTINSITYKRKDISCELCHQQLPDYIKHNNIYFNISFYDHKFNEYMVL